MPAAGSPWPRLGGVKITLQRAIQLYIDQWPGSTLTPHYHAIA